MAVSGRRRRPDVRPAAIVLGLILAAGACVPAGSGATRAPTTPAPSPSTSVRPSFVRPTPTPRPTPISYIVRTGDTLTSIARANRTTARSIAFWNRSTYPSLDPDSATYAPDRIAVGWRLVLIPGVVVDESELLDASASPAASPESSGG